MHLKCGSNLRIAVARSSTFAVFLVFTFRHKHYFPCTATCAIFKVKINPYLENQFHFLSIDEIDLENLFRDTVQGIVIGFRRRQS